MASTSIFVERGDQSIDDFTLGDLTTDNTWRDLDLSSIVPAGASAVLLSGYVVDDAASSFLGFRKNGNTANQSARYTTTQVANIAIDFEVLVPCDSSRVVEYKASNLTFSAIVIRVQGWFVPVSSSKVSELTEDTSPEEDNLLYTVKDPNGTPLDRMVTVPNLMKLAFTDRGDKLTSHDFTQADLTMDNSWYQLDLSSIVPSGTKWVCLYVSMSDPTAGTYIIFRRDGSSSDTRNRSICRTQAISMWIDYDVWIQVDSNRQIKYLCNEAFTSLNITVKGWIGAGAMTTTTT